MSVNLQRFRTELLAAWRDVLDDSTSTDWALFSYDGQSNDLKPVSKGDCGVDELREELNSGKVMYAFIKVDDPKTGLAKFVLLNWQGEGAPVVRKGTCVNHMRDISALFTGAHLTLNARTEEDIDAEIIADKLAKAGSTYDFKTPRPGPDGRIGPVGTVYQKVNPSKEIDASERDRFWMKEEQEEKNRVAAEKVRREQERARLEEETRARDAEEAAERDRAAERRNQAIAKRKAAEHSQEIARRREEDHRETQRLLREQEEAGNRTAVAAGEALRRERSKEAKELIGHSTSQTRALFEKNTAQGQMNNRSHVVPQKPVRNSLMARRIDEFSNAPTSPTKPVSPSETGPIKNIDKIKLSLESPSQIQQSIDPTISDLSPSEVIPVQFSAIPNEESEGFSANSQSEDFVKQNILENDIYDASLSVSSGNDVDDDDSDNKFSTIKRSPHSKNNISDGSADDSTRDRDDQSRQNTVVENANYAGNGHADGSNTPDDVSPEALEDDGIYQDLDDDPGLTARALYDYQAVDDTEITFDPGDIITHIDQIDEGWWQGLGPHGVFGLFPANYVELLPRKTKQ